MRSWYYMDNEERRGPVAEADLRTLLRAGRLAPDVYVWAEGMPDWLPASDVHELAHGSFDEDDTSISGPQERPWVRYWARLLDLVLAAIVVGALHEPLAELPDLIFTVLVSAVWMFAEVALLSTWGTTPGKALLRVQVRTVDGHKLSTNTAFVRYFHMWMRGQGFNLPFVNLIANLAAYMTLTSQGSTSWDRIAGTVVLHRRVGVVRTASVIVLLALVVMLSVWAATTEIAG